MKTMTEQQKEIFKDLINKKCRINPGDRMLLEYVYEEKYSGMISEAMDINSELVTKEKTEHIERMATAMYNMVKKNNIMSNEQFLDHLNWVVFRAEYPKITFSIIGDKIKII